MERLSAWIIFVMFIAFWILPLSAEACGRYSDELIKQNFEVTIDGTTFNLYFGDSIFGPCPGGIAILSYIDIQFINEVEYTTELEFDFYYNTTPDIVTVAGLDFILFDGKLILLPDDPLIFNVIE